MRVNPMIITMTPSGRGSQATVQITNVTDIDLPVEMSIVKRTLVDGEEVLVPAEEDFILFPPQFIINPGASQTVRLQWVSGAIGNTSESYYVYATQIPVPLQDGQSGVMVNYRFGISLHMVPEGTEPKVVVEGLQPAQNEEGEQGFELTVRNTGTRYARMSEHRLTLKNSAGDAREWSTEALKADTGVGFMLPGESRTFFIAYTEDLGSSPAAELQYRAPQG